MPLDWNALVCNWKPGGDEPPGLNASKYDYVITKMPAAALLKIGTYPQLVYDLLPQWARDNEKLMLLYAVAYQDEIPVIDSAEYGFELNGQSYWCEPEEYYGAEPSSSTWPILLATGIGLVGGLAAATFLPARPMSMKGTIASGAIGAFAGLLGGMYYLGTRENKA